MESNTSPDPSKAHASASERRLARLVVPAGTVGQVATILTGAVRDVASAVGGLATEMFEIREAARRAAEHLDPADGDSLT